MPLPGLVRDKMTGMFWLVVVYSVINHSYKPSSTLSSWKMYLIKSIKPHYLSLYRDHPPCILRGSRVIPAVSGTLPVFPFPQRVTVTDGRHSRSSPAGNAARLTDTGGPGPRWHLSLMQPNGRISGHARGTGQPSVNPTKISAS